MDTVLFEQFVNSIAEEGQNPLVARRCLHHRFSSIEDDELVLYCLRCGEIFRKVPVPGWAAEYSEYADDPPRFEDDEGIPLMQKAVIFTLTFLSAMMLLMIGWVLFG